MLIENSRTLTLSLLKRNDERSSFVGSADQKLFFAIIKPNVVQAKTISKYRVDWIQARGGDPLTNRNSMVSKELGAELWCLSWEGRVRAFFYTRVAYLND
jgi:hypothetical protein